MADDNRGAAALTWGPAAELSFKNAVQHFNRFLEQMIEEPDGERVALLLFGTESPQNVSYEASKKECIDIKLMDHFALYLAKTARCSNNFTKKLVCNTADRYLSAMKTRIERDLMYNAGNTSLPDQKMKIVRTGMMNAFRDHAIANNEPLSKSHATPCFEDITRVCLVSMWLNDFKFANFAFFVLSLVQFAGRGTEAAVLPFNRIELRQPAEFAAAGPWGNKIAYVTLWRKKTRTEQTLAIFHNRDSFLMCWYFMAAYSMIMNDNSTPSDSVFPNFVKTFGQENTASSNVVHDENVVDTVDINELDESTTEAKGVSKYFKDIYKLLVNAAKRLTALVDCDRQEGIDQPVPRAPAAASSFIDNANGYAPNPLLSSHSGKRFAVNLADIHPGIKTTWVCFRAGWIMKSVHTIFDYLSASAKNDHQVALVTANWTETGEGGRYCGGRPPSLQSLIDCNSGGTDMEQVEDFVRALFGSYCNVAGANNEELQKLLTASILLRLDQFLLALKEHPQGKYGLTDVRCYKEHRFLQCLFDAARRARIEDPITTLNAWAKLILVDFHKRNYGLLPDKLDDHDVSSGDHDGSPCHVHGEPNTFEGRTVAGICRETASKMGALGENQVHLITLFRQLKESSLRVEKKQDDIMREQQEQRQMLQEQRQMMQQLISSNGATFPAATTAVVLTNNIAVNNEPHESEMEPSILPPTLAGLGVKSLFIKWHRDGGYLTLHKVENKSVRSIMKFVIEFFTLFLDSHIEALPPSATCGYFAPDWTKKLESKVNTAWKSLLIFAKSHSIAVSLEAATTFKKEMCKLDANLLPEGPNGESIFQPEGKKLRTRSDLIRHKEVVPKKRKRGETNAEDLG